MTKYYASLKHIDNNRKITRETDYAFWHQLQTGLLLALKEKGYLNEMQYNQAQEKLNKQYREPKNRGGGG